MFENPNLQENAELIDGTSLGRLLAEVQVPVLVLNACRSAHAEPAVQPSMAADPDSQVRSFGSLAQEVMDAGAVAVVAMGYNVYVVTAAQFAAELYASLCRGAILGEAATLARKNLADNPLRDVSVAPLPLQDWPVPIIYEAAPLRLFPGAMDTAVVEGIVHIAPATTSTLPPLQRLDPDLPSPPDFGIFGRDETLLALDRAFDRDRIVLLHAYAGSGKTVTAAEFARWFALTGGVDGPVLFSSFEHYLPLPRALDRIGQAFGSFLERTGTHWLSLDDRRRQEVALQLLDQVPVLWIWDNVEPVAGFPLATESAWRADEQADLASFLRAAKATKARFLLTSRRAELAWLGDLPTRITLPRMPLTESLQLTRALAGKAGRRISEVEDWRQLLLFADGNPLTITVVVRQALSEKLITRQQIEAFVSRLRSGEAAFPDEASEGRSKSLGASLAYGFERGFSDDERQTLALLHLFQSFVQVAVLVRMGLPDAGSLPTVRGLTQEAGVALLDRATEVGLLTSYGSGHYSVHPALPWFFRSVFEQWHPKEGIEATHSFVRAMAWMGEHLLSHYAEGKRDLIATLRAEEANLLHARHLSLVHGFHGIIGTMQGLRVLYEHTGRRSEWKRLVEEILPQFVNAKDDGPLPGVEREWHLVTEYRVALAEDERHWAEAARLLELKLKSARNHATPYIDSTLDDLNEEKREALHTLAGTLIRLGDICSHLRRADCFPAYEEALNLSLRFGYRPLAASCAFNLSRAYMELSAQRDLDKAELWCRRSLELHLSSDRLGRGECHRLLGSIAMARISGGSSTEMTPAEVLRYLDEAASFYRDALTILPDDAVKQLAVTQNLLGTTYGFAGHIERSLPHFREALRLFEASDNTFHAAQARFNLALALFKLGRPSDAHEYAKAALLAFDSYGDSAAQRQTRELIADIGRS